jgi:hypothetical protein
MTHKERLLRISSIIFLACLVSSFYGCTDDEESSSSTVEETAEEAAVDHDNGGGSGSGNGGREDGTGDTTPTMIGTPEAELIALDHDVVTSALRANLTTHIDDIDDAISTIEDSATLESMINLLSGDDEEEVEGDPTSEEDVEDSEEDEDFEVDLSEIRDGLIEVLTEKILHESSAVTSDDGKTVTYTLSADTVCTDDDEDEDQDESPEAIEERVRDFEECVQRIADHPVVIKATSIGEQKINFAITVGENTDDVLRLQIHDDLIAAFIPMGSVKSILRMLVSEEHLELPDTMVGVVGVEARREDRAHFALRFAILEDILITSDEAESVKVELAQTNAPGGITLNGPEKIIEGYLNLSTLQAQLPWQEIVNIFYDDEGEMYTECYDNSAEVESCRRYREDCLNSCEADMDRESCRNRCLDELDGQVRVAVESLNACMDTIPESECALEDIGCREARCSGETMSYNEVCEYRSWCEEIYEEASEPPEVEGNLKVFLKAVAGRLRFDGNADTIELQDATLGDETMTIKVKDDQIIGVDLNPEDGRAVSLMMSSAEGGNVKFQLTPALDVRVALTLKHVWEAFVEDQEDLPDVLADDVLGIRFAGSDAPTLETIGDDEGRQMLISSGTLTLSSPHLDENVVIEEGMCMSSEDDDELSDEERESRHDLFGGMMSVACE